MHYDGDLIDDRWLHFVEPLITGVTLAPHPYACVSDYRFRTVSHPYIVCGAEEDRLSVVPHFRGRNPRNEDTQPSSQQEHQSTISSFVLELITFIF